LLVLVFFPQKHEVNVVAQVDNLKHSINGVIHEEGTKTTLPMVMLELGNEERDSGQTHTFFRAVGMANTH
jgi:hypothetical protein